MYKEYKKNYKEFYTLSGKAHRQKSAFRDSNLVHGENRRKMNRTDHNRVQ